MKRSKLCPFVNALGVLGVFVGVALMAAPLEGQSWIAPSIGYSKQRDLGLGLSAGRWLTSSARVRLGAMEFFQGTDGIADPGVDVTASFRHLNLDLLYHTRPGGLGPYVGLGGGVEFSRLALARGTETGEADRTGWYASLLAGMRVPIGRWVPYADARRTLDLQSGWFFSAGVEYELR